MKKTRRSLFYRLFGWGSIPKKLCPILEEEGILHAEEGIPGSLHMRDVRGPGRWHKHHTAGFSGSLVVTKERVLAYTFGRRQIQLPVKDARIGLLHVAVPESERLTLSFESSEFREGWRGVIELRFHTVEASRFEALLREAGASTGHASRHP